MKRDKNKSFFYFSVHFLPLVAIMVAFTAPASARNGCESVAVDPIAVITAMRAVRAQRDLHGYAAWLAPESRLVQANGVILRDRAAIRLALAGEMVSASVRDRPLSTRKALQDTGDVVVTSTVLRAIVPVVGGPATQQRLTITSVLRCTGQPGWRVISQKEHAAAATPKR